ncbi:unc-50 family protein [Cystoisospora suis]|uniref:Unc-50 family protein n=1 Tax=Cystoisospora suis TaxID=483139 RepID=A0A2C6J6H8_9APIC|nr:unc-50 family protein [Cystoisospora suis]
MLPTYHRGGCPCFPSLVPPATFTSFLSSFCHRLAHFSLMDLQFSFAQFSLLVFSPRKVYEFANIRKKQKNYYARDDPGFLLLLLVFFLATGLAYGFAFSRTTIGCLLTAFAPATYLLLSALLIPPVVFLCLHYWAAEAEPATRRGSHRLAQAEPARVLRQKPAGPPELFFCFDVHWNASFVYLLVGLVVQFFVFPVFDVLPAPLACLLGNFLQVVAVTSYCYITALGYTSLSFTESPLPFFAPAAIFLMASLVATALSFNFADVCLHFLLYFERQVLPPQAADSSTAATPSSGSEPAIAVPALNRNGGIAVADVVTSAPGSVSFGGG